MTQPKFIKISTITLMKMIIEDLQDALKPFHICTLALKNLETASTSEIYVEGYEASQLRNKKYHLLKRDYPKFTKWIKKIGKKNSTGLPYKLGMAWEVKGRKKRLKLAETFLQDLIEKSLDT